MTADRPQRRSSIDPAVAAIMGDRDRKEAEARLPREERSKKSKERKKAADRLAGRVNLDLPPALKKQVFDLAVEQGIPASQIVAFFLADGLRRLAAGEVDLRPYKRASESPRYDWNLDIPEYTEKPRKREK
jgi:hypothetical protein